MSKLSVLIPAFNEERTIRRILEKVRAVDLGGIEKEIIVVDDGSSDATWARLQEIDWPELVKLRHERNAGKGRAIRTGLARITGDIVIVQDADLEYDPADYPRLVEPIRAGRFQAVYGSRFAGHDAFANYPWTHFFGVRFLNWLAKALYGVRLTDEATCYKAFSRDAIADVPLDCERFEFCPEITAKVARKGIAIHEVPISFNPRTAAEGKKIRWRDGWTAARTLWKYRSWTPAKSPSG